MKKVRIRLTLLFLLDITIILFSYIASTLLITNFVYDSGEILEVIDHLYWIIPVYIFTFILFKLYTSLWRYASIEEALNVLWSVLTSFSIIILVKFIFHLNFGVNNLIIASLLIYLALIGIRFSYRALRIILLYKKNQNNINTCIIGAGNAGILMIKEIKHNPMLNNKVVCLIDDDPSKLGKIIQGIKVVGTTRNLKKVVFAYRIDEIIVAMPSITREEMQEVLKKCDKLKKRTKLLPPFYEVIDKKFSLNKVRNVEIEDLLGRDVIKIDDQGIKDFINDEVVLVTGGGGSIGSELCRQIIKYTPKKLIIFDIYENNAYDIQNELLRYFHHNDITNIEIQALIGSVRDEERLKEVFDEYKPTIVFHAAAHKHVPLMEVSPKEAIKNNIFGTYNMAKISDEYKVKKFVLISTDKAVNPTNIMGATKRFAEMIIQAFNKVSETQYAAVRFGNVLGSNGSVIPLFKKQIAGGGPVTVTHKDIIRYFMTIPEAVQLVLQAGAFAKGGEIFVLDMGEPVKILDLAEKLIRFSGFEPYSGIDIEITGLRPGDKLYEELLMDDEGLIATHNEKIFVSEVNGVNLPGIKKQLVELQDVLSNDQILIQEIFSQYVKTYKSINNKK